MWLQENTQIFFFRRGVELLRRGSVLLYMTELRATKTTKYKVKKRVFLGLYNQANEAHTVDA